MDIFRDLRGDGETLTLARRAERILISAHHLKNKVFFLRSCLEEKICPMNLGVISENSYDGSPFPKYKEDFIKDRIMKAKHEKDERFMESRDAIRKLREKCDPATCELVLSRVLDRTRYNERKGINIIKNKLELLFSRSQWVKGSLTNNIKNFSRRLLTRDQMVILGLGLGFCMGPPEEFHIVFNSEVNILNTLQHNDVAAFLRGVAYQATGNGRVKYLPKRLVTALTDLKKLDDIRITKADKGGTVVILNMEEYRSKMENLLGDEDTYVRIDNPTSITSMQSKFNREVKKIIMGQGGGDVEKDLVKKVTSCKLPCMPYMYGLPKVHKEGRPLRPIVSSRNSPQANLSKWLGSVLSKYLGVFSNAHIKHNLDFIERLKDLNLADKQMASFDVTSLFTKVPVAHLLEFLRSKAQEGIFTAPIEITKFLALIKLCIEETIFTFENRVYKQKFGVSMGSSLSPLLANLYMEMYESVLVPRIMIDGIRPLLWVRYVDDVFVLFPKDFVKLDEYVNGLNSIEDSIQFTCERESERSLPFLDTRVKISQEGRTQFSVFRKKTHTNSYVHFYSYHSTKIKRGIIVGLVLRALRVCDPTLLDEEFNYIRKSFEELAYPKWIINEAFERANRIFHSGKEKERWNKEGREVIKVPYLQAYDKTLDCRLDAEDKFPKVVFNFQNTVGRKVVNNRGRNRVSNGERTEVGGGVYVIPCKDCNKKYVGETGRDLDTRLNEHRRAISINANNSAIAKHVWEENHRVDFRSSSVIYKSNSTRTRRTVEGAVINAIQVFDNNKGFSSEDPLTRKKILNEARLNLNSLKGISQAPGQSGVAVPQSNLDAPTIVAASSDIVYNLRRSQRIQGRTPIVNSVSVEPP